MYLVLCSSADTPALWAYEGLKSAGLFPLHLITSEQLAFAPAWEHRVGSDGVHLKVRLADGYTICGSRVRGVLNRLLSAPLDLTNLAVPSDRDYATGELAAFYLSWLNTLPGCISRPTPQGLSGRWRHASEWAMLASAAGLPVPPYRQSSASKPEAGYASLAPEGNSPTSVIVLRNQVYGPAVPYDTADACKRLAASCSADLMGIDLFRGEQGKFHFASATPFPDLTLGGPKLIEGLAGALTAGGLQ